MKIVLNTTEPDAVASYNYINLLKKDSSLTFNDFKNYQKYNVALFLSYKNDLKEIVSVKKKYPDLIIGIIDPRGSNIDNIID